MHVLMLSVVAGVIIAASVVYKKKEVKQVLTRQKMLVCMTKSLIPYTALISHCPLAHTLIAGQAS